ncbi:MAG: hypothetical protein QGF46_06150, partial [Planctomycetota bacterium]|nr:hypothetical protein [Planctomycetota bacterium]
MISIYFLLLSSIAPQSANEECTMCLGSEKRMQTAGVLNHGPFQFFTTDSETIEQHIKNDDIMWIETENFRVGCDLKSWKIPVKEKKIYLKELTEFAKAFPHIKPKKIKTLDPWMRAHLMAWRAENAYQQLLSELGWDEDPFSTMPEESTFVNAAAGAWSEILEEVWQNAPPRKEGLPQWIGLGKYMGMPMKHEVLLLINEKDISAVKRDYIGKLDSHPQRWHNDWEPFNESPVS